MNNKLEVIGIDHMNRGRMKLLRKKFKMMNQK